MVQRAVKIPKHGGPDGQGLPRVAFDELKVLLRSTDISDAQAKDAIELCLMASTQSQWNDEYRTELIEIIDETKR